MILRGTKEEVEKYLLENKVIFTSFTITPFTTDMIIDTTPPPPPLPPVSPPPVESLRCKRLARLERRTNLTYHSLGKEDRLRIAIWKAKWYKGIPDFIQRVVNGNLPLDRDVLVYYKHMQIISRQRDINNQRLVSEIDILFIAVYHVLLGEDKETEWTDHGFRLEEKVKANKGEMSEEMTMITDLCDLCDLIKSSSEKDLLSRILAEYALCYDDYVRSPYLSNRYNMAIAWFHVVMKMVGRQEFLDEVEIISTDYAAFDNKIDHEVRAIRLHQMSNGSYTHLSTLDRAILTDSS